MSSAKLTIESRALTISNPEKLLFPEVGFSKAMVIDYYARVAPFLLPHLKNRPVTMKRYPDGIHGKLFYEKNAPRYTPEWVKTFPIPRESSGRSVINYILINDTATLVWLANLANLEIHPFLHRVPKTDTPTSVVFDLDPGEHADVLDCAIVAFRLRDYLESLKLQCFAKVSGSRGLHIHVPLNSPATYERTKPFAHSVAEFLEAEHPDLAVSKMSKDERQGKVFIDWSQNAEHKTTVGVYSLRAKREQPFVSFPVNWDELREAVRKKKPEALNFTPAATLERLKKEGDLFANVLKLKQKLPESLPPESLAAYGGKRDFSATREPPPAAPRSGSGHRFVIQKHSASRLHYDFRLEMNGVLKSWAVPKGPPYTPAEKRLAMAVEDHPIEYLDFEGTIPKGQYGGGTVMVWDIGNYELLEGDYGKGKLHVYLTGKKLKGEWYLVKTKDEEGRRWLLMKSSPGIEPPANEDLSAITGRGMEQIAEDNDAQWNSNRGGEGPPGVDLSRLPRASAKFVEPMQSKPVARLPGGGGWQYEIKLDGFRALAFKNNGLLELLSRNRLVLNGRFPEVAAALEALGDGTILDGEIVAVNKNGWPDFYLLQGGGGSVLYYVFDVLAWHGRSLLGLPLRKRRAVLEWALEGWKDPVRLLGTLDAEPESLVSAAGKRKIEGFVAKRLDSVYEPGKRTGKWVKYRLKQGQDLVIGGYIPGRNHFSGLIAGYYENGALLYAATVVNGFVAHAKDKVFEKLKPLETAGCPFANLPEPPNTRGPDALTKTGMKKCCWLKPEIVANIGFTGWTAANRLREARFIGLRDDKNPKEVTHERPE